MPGRGRRRDRIGLLEDRLRGGESYLELLEGQGPESGVTRWIIDAALSELRAKGVKLRDESSRIGHGGARIAFIDPSATGSVLIELAELPAGHGAHA